MKSEFIKIKDTTALLPACSSNNKVAQVYFKCILTGTKYHSVQIPKPP